MRSRALRLKLPRMVASIHLVDPESPEARHCLHAYYGELARRFSTGFDVSLSCDPEADALRPPRGAFLVARGTRDAVGCIGLKAWTSGTEGEIKRLWVAREARGHGLGRRLLAMAEARARALGHGVLRLDTNSALPEARALYLATGWREIPRFNDDPYPDLFFEKALDPA